MHKHSENNLGQIYWPYSFYFQVLKMDESGKKKYKNTKPLNFKTDTAKILDPQIKKKKKGANFMH